MEAAREPTASHIHPTVIPERNVAFREVKTRDLTAIKRRITQVDARSRVFAIATLRDDEEV